MNENDKYFIKRYEELLNKGYCDCNEMNCIDNNSPRRILNIVNDLQSKIDKANKLIETYKNERNIYKWLAETYIKKYNDSNCCRYEEDRDE